MSQSVAVASTDTGEVLGAVRIPYGLSLHATLRARLCSRLFQLLRLLAATLGVRVDALQNSSLCIGLTGATFDHDWDREVPSLFSAMDFRPVRLLCTGDAEIVFASHALRESGKALLCHSGSVAFARASDVKVRFGGWGPVLGDEGSGYWIGMQALRLIAEQHDLGTRSSLWDAIESWLEGATHEVECWREAACHWRMLIRSLRAGTYDSRTAVFSFAHMMDRELGLETWRKVVSGLTIPILAASQAGNSDAQMIVQLAADKLVQQLKAASVRACSPFTIGPVVFYGGTLRHHPGLTAAVLERLIKEGVSESDVVFPGNGLALRPACGALLFAANGSPNLRLPDETVCKNIIATSKRFPALCND